MKHKLLALLCTLLVLCCTPAMGRVQISDSTEFSSSVNLKPIKIGVYHHPPYMYMEDGKASHGIIISQLDYFMKHMNRKYELISLPYKDLIDCMAQNTIDFAVIPLQACNEDQIKYHSLIFLTGHIGMFTKRSSNYTSLESISYCKASVLDKCCITSISSMLPSNVRLTQESDFAQEVQLLEAGKIEVIIGDEMRLNYEGHHSGLSALKYKLLPLPSIKRVFVLAANEVHAPLISEVNHAIVAEALDGSLNKVFEKEGAAQYFNDFNYYLQLFLVIGPFVLLALIAIFTIVYLKGRKSRLELKYRRNVMRTVLDALPHPIQMEDVDKGCEIVYRNPASFTAYPDLENTGVKGYSMDRLLFRRSHETSMEVVKTGQEYDDIEQYRHSNGEPHACYTRKWLVEENNYSYVYSVRIDVTELIEARKKLEMAEKLKSLFLANMSHDIRTPVNAITGFAHMIKDIDDNESIREFSKHISQNNEYLLELLNDVVDLAKYQSGASKIEVQWYDVTEQMNELEKVFYVILEKLKKTDQVHLHKVNPYKNFRILADRHKVTRVIHNFLSNACKYTLEGDVYFGAIVQNNKLLVFVSDTGVGIANEKQRDVFKSFAKLDDIANGTGIGMAIAKAIIESHDNGQISLVSEIGKGSLFYFTIDIEADTQEKENYDWTRIQSYLSQIESGIKEKELETAEK